MIENGDEVTLLYACDTWHTKDSLFLLGAFVNRMEALAFLEEHLVVCRLPELGEDDTMMFMDFGQTQGYEGEGEFYTNTLVIGEREGCLA